MSVTPATVIFEIIFILFCFILLRNLKAPVYLSTENRHEVGLISDAKTFFEKKGGERKKYKKYVLFCLKITKHLYQPKMFNESRVLYIF